MQNVFNYLNSHTSQMLSDIKTLVELESPSKHPQHINAVMDVIEGWMTDLGAVLKTRVPSENGDHRLFRLQGKNPERVVILSHADTVWALGTLQKMPFKVDGDIAYGPGIYDMKAGIVQTIWALKALKTPKYTIDFLITSDEEIGSTTSQGIIEELAQGAKAVLVTEPSNPQTFTLKTSRKGCGTYDFEFYGVSAHAGGQPEKGASAIIEMAQQALQVNNLADHALGTTVNVGVVSGGTVTNAIPDRASMAVDFRVTQLAEAERMANAVASLKTANSRVSMKVSGGLNRPPFERSAGTAHLYTIAEGIAAELGFRLGEDASGGGSDGNFTATLAPTLDGLGACGDGAHALHEQIVISKLPERAALMAGILERL